VNYKLHLFIVAFFPILTGCIPITTVKVSLDNTSIEKRKVNETFTSYSPERSDTDIELLRFDISTEQDLYEHFVTDWGKLLGVSCYPVGVARKGAFNASAVGPIYNNVDITSGLNNTVIISNPPIKEDGLYKYTIYAFSDFKSGSNVASFATGHSTVISKRFDLVNERFEKLACHIVGGDFMPIITPRSNDFGIDEKQFRSLYTKYSNAN
jgi:hypothetical protein